MLARQWILHLSFILKKDINVCHPLLTATFVLQMLSSLGLLFILSLFFLNLSPYDQIHILVVFNPLVISSVPKDFPPPPPLQVYHRHHTFHRPLNDYVLVLDSLPLPDLMVEPDLSIALCKGIHSTCNSSPHYTALSYHQLSQPSFVYFFYMHSKVY